MRTMIPINAVVQRNHPDARACIIALPFNERGGTQAWDRAGKGGSKPITGNILNTDWTTGLRGWGVKQRAFVIGVLATNAINPSRGDGVSAVCNITITAAVPSLVVFLFRVGGHAFGWNAAGAGLSLGPYSCASNDVSGAGITLVNGLSYSLGWRFRPGVATSTDFFINGVKSIGVAGTPAAGASNAFSMQIPNAGPNQAASCTMSDLRVFDRFMPDSTFERFYTNPKAFYTAGSPAWMKRGAISGLFGNFLPFMHPSFTS